MAGIQIFISHGSKYADLAKSFKRSLQALDSSDATLNIQLSQDMAGSVNWRRWIDQNVRSSDVFVLLYPHSSMDMNWCNYELGRFYDTDEDRRIVCIRNTDIERPPPAFDPFQSYAADVAGFGKFLRELFVEGTFTKGAALNPHVGQISEDYFKRAGDVAKELAEQFAQSRLKAQLYERRIVVSVRQDERRAFDKEASRVQGNVEGLNLLGLGAGGDIKWSAVRRTLGDTVDWPAELERVMPTIANGELPPALPPFRTATGIYIPVITKSESVDGALREVALIFVTVNERCLRPLLNWALPPAMPERMTNLVRMVRPMFRARWEIVEPRYQEAAFEFPSDERCAEMAQQVLTEYDELRVEFERDGMTGMDKFYATFDRDLRVRARALSDEYILLIKELRAAPSWNAAALKEQLRKLLLNNAGWLQVAAQQFGLTAAEYVDD